MYIKKKNGLKFITRHVACVVVNVLLSRTKPYTEFTSIPPMTTLGTLTYVLAVAALGSAVAPCTLPSEGPKMYMRCSIKDQTVPCGGVVKPETTIQFNCAEFYSLSNKESAIVECLPSGHWNQSIPKCIPTCGKLPSAVPLIVRGKIVTASTFPWQAALYHNGSDGWEFWCGGNLISSRMILTAAHCAWKVSPEHLKVALGKRYREEHVEGETSQMIKVEKVEMLASYQDVNGNYNGDLALLLLKEAASMSATVAPACIDWEQKYIDQQLREGNSGIVLGWGLTENDTFSDELRAVRLPVMSDERCIQQQQRDFKKYVTYTSFCAGFDNGTGVCNGDSGGGLSFLDEKSDTWYLQGLVSVSPRRRGTPYCDPTYYTVFTKVAMFTTWLRKMEQLEQYIEDQAKLAPGAVLPHTAKITG